jgi:carbon-monoxide dehydrogenase small subunit
MKIDITVNGDKRSITVNPLSRLLDILRNEFALRGTKEGCGEGECGACSVLMNKLLVNSCLIPVAQCDGAEIVTIEGLSETERGKVLTSAFAETHAVQCGFCTPGMVLAAESLLQKKGKPTEQEIREGLAGNICRCTGYDMIIDGIQLAAEKGDGLW